MTISSVDGEYLTEIHFQVRKYSSEGKVARYRIKNVMTSLEDLFTNHRFANYIVFSVLKCLKDVELCVTGH